MKIIFLFFLIGKISGKMDFLSGVRQKSKLVLVHPLSSFSIKPDEKIQLFLTPRLSSTRSVFLFVCLVSCIFTLCGTRFVRAWKFWCNTRWSVGHAMIQMWHSCALCAVDGIHTCQTRELFERVVVAGERQRRSPFCKVSRRHLSSLHSVTPQHEPQMLADLLSTELCSADLVVYESNL